MSHEHLHAIREQELQRALQYFPEPAADVTVLDLGSGTGLQSAYLASLGYSVIALDIASSAYAETQVYPVTNYDGHTLPVKDKSIDIFFSSNVLEHIPHLDEILFESARVLSDNGLAIHVLPTASWRIYTTLTYYPSLIIRALKKGLGLSKPPGTSKSNTRHAASWAKDLFPSPHGERGSIFTEAFYFRTLWWKTAFERAGFDIKHTINSDIFYTGSILFGLKIPISFRKILSSLLGSSCRIYVLHKKSGKP